MLRVKNIIPEGKSFNGVGGVKYMNWIKPKRGWVSNPDEIVVTKIGAAEPGFMFDVYCANFNAE